MRFPTNRWLSPDRAPSIDTHKVHCLRRPIQREAYFGATSVNHDFPELLAQAVTQR